MMKKSLKSWKIRGKQSHCKLTGKLSYATYLPLQLAKSSPASNSVTHNISDDSSEQSPGERSSTQSSSTHDTSESPPATDHDAQSVGTNPTLVNQDPAATVGNTSMQQPPQES